MAPCGSARVDHRLLGVQPAWQAPPAWQLTRCSHTCQPQDAVGLPGVPSTLRAGIPDATPSAVNKRWLAPEPPLLLGVEAGAGDLWAVGGGGNRVRHAAHGARAAAGVTAAATARERPGYAAGTPRFAALTAMNYAAACFWVALSCACWLAAMSALWRTTVRSSSVYLAGSRTASASRAAL